MLFSFLFNICVSYHLGCKKYGHVKYFAGVSQDPAKFTKQNIIMKSVWCLHRRINELYFRPKILES